MKKNIKTLVIAILGAGVLSLSACNKYHHIDPHTEQEKKQNNLVYGEVDGPAEQSLQEYENDPEQPKKASAAKEALFTEDWGLNKKKPGVMADSLAIEGKPKPEAADTATVALSDTTMGAVQELEGSEME